MTKAASCLTFSVILLLILHLTTVVALEGRQYSGRIIMGEHTYPELGELDGTTPVEIERTLWVENVNDVPVNVSLFLTPEAEEFITLLDTDKELEPGEEWKPRFLVSITRSGSVEGNINTAFTSLTTDEPGVVIPTKVKVTGKPGEDYEYVDDSSGLSGLITGGSIGTREGGSLSILTISTIILFVALALLVLYARRKKTLEVPKEDDVEKTE